MVLDENGTIEHNSLGTTRARGTPRAVAAAVTPRTLLGTPGVLTRPWCIVELYSAPARGIPIGGFQCKAAASVRLCVAEHQWAERDPEERQWRQLVALRCYVDDFS